MLGRSVGVGGVEGGEHVGQVFVVFEIKSTVDELCVFRSVEGGGGACWSSFCCCF